MRKEVKNMEMLEISLPSISPLATEYIKGSFPIQTGFHYNIHEENVYHARLAEIRERVYPRQEVVEHLLQYHQKFSVSQQTLSNIQRLLHPESVVVIGGQQAGLLTGPLYTIYKIVSIITLAKQQENKLGIPVVPVFWIAGEDHDIAEINHIYVMEQGKVKKKLYPEKFPEKRLASELVVDKQLCIDWVKSIVETYGETNITNELLSFMEDSLSESKTVVDFFASIVLRLFAKEGLVVINAAEPALRAIEKEFIVNLLRSHQEITRTVLAQQEALKGLGYKPLIDIHPQSVHLFYQHEGERLALEVDELSKKITTKRGEVSFNFEGLVSLISSKPEVFSNNVVTRPLMQEYLFPTLAFIAGPGEVAYWAELKEAFALFDFKMPPVVPRMNITIVERSIYTDMRDMDINITDVLRGNIEKRKNEWIAKQVKYPLDEIFAKAKADVEEIHRSLRVIGLEIDRGLEGLLAKNASLLQSHLDFLQQKLQQRINETYEIDMRKFARIESSLAPNNAPQERVWNVFYYVNKYGFDFIAQLIHGDWQCNGMHKIVYI